MSSNYGSTGSRPLQEFFVVTTTSIYHVQAQGACSARAVKIALRNESSLPIGHDLCHGTMLAVCKWLQAFTPEGHGAIDQRSKTVTDIAQVNTHYWHDKSSQIVAMFLDETEARECFAVDDGIPCDQRWLNSTRAVLETIGNNHPSFSVPQVGDLALLPI